MCNATPNAAPDPVGVEVTDEMVQAALAESRRVIWSAPDEAIVGDVAFDSMRAAITAALAIRGTP